MDTLYALRSQPIDLEETDYLEQLVGEAQKENRFIYVYDSEGVIGYPLYNWFVSQGFENVYFLKGGSRRWFSDLSSDTVKSIDRGATAEKQAKGTESAPVKK